jgi:hypothetical protein
MKKKNKSFSDNDIYPPSKAVPSSVQSDASDGSQSNLHKKQSKEKNKPDLTLYSLHLTVKVKIHFTRKQLCLLSGVLIREIIEKGIGLRELVLTEFFLARLLGSKDPILEMNDEKEQITVLSLQSILFGIGSIGLDEQKKKFLPKEIQELLESSPYLPSRRTVGSWKQSYSIDKWFEILTVPVEIYFERSGSSTPYDSYCKGYGESHPSLRKKKTKYNSELDGEEILDTKTGEGKLPLFSLGWISTYLAYQIRYTKDLKYRREK